MLGHYNPYDGLKKLMDSGIEKFQILSQKECYLLIGSSGLRNNISNFQINYLIDDKALTHTKWLNFPELHQVNEATNICECPDFHYHGRMEAKLCQALSLEIASKVIKKINGLIINLNYADSQVGRGTVYIDIVHQLSQLFRNDLDLLFKSAVVMLSHIPDDYTKDDVIYYLNCQYVSEETNIESEEAEEIGHAEKLIAASHFTKHLASNANHVVLLNPRDQGESREELLSALSRLSPIESSQLNYAACYKPLLKGLNFNATKYIDDIVSASLCEKLVTLKL